MWRCVDSSQGISGGGPQPRVFPSNAASAAAGNSETFEKDYAEVAKILGLNPRLRLAGFISKITGVKRTTTNGRLQMLKMRSFVPKLVRNAGGRKRKIIDASVVGSRSEQGEAFVLPNVLKRHRLPCLPISIEDAQLPEIFHDPVADAAVQNAVGAQDLAQERHDAAAGEDSLADNVSLGLPFVVSATTTDTLRSNIKVLSNESAHTKASMEHRLMSRQEFLFSLINSEVIRYISVIWAL